MSKALLAVPLFSAFVLTMLIPITGVDKPTFTNLIFLHYSVFAFLFGLTMVIIPLAISKGNEPIVVLSTVIFSMSFLLTIPLKVPGALVGSNVPGDHTAFVYLEALTNGHVSLSTVSYGPTIFMVVSTLQSLVGFKTGFAIYLLYRATAIPVFSYLVAKTLTNRTEVSAIATIGSIIANPFFFGIGDSLYAPSSSGVVYFLIGVFLLLLYNRTHSDKTVTLLLLIALATTLEYPLAAFLLISEALVVYFLSKMSRKLRYAGGIVLVSSIIFVGWYSLKEPLTNLIQFWVLNLFAKGIQHPSLTSGSETLAQRFLSVFGHQPSVLLPFTFLWVGVIFGGGAIAWVRYLIKERNTLVYLFVPLLLTGALLTIPQGSYAEERIVGYAGIFLSTFLVAFISVKSRRAAIFLLVLMVFTALPTLAAYNPAVGFNAAQYSSDYSAGNFLHFSPIPVSLYSLAGVHVTNFSIVSQDLVDDLHIFNDSLIYRIYTQSVGQAEIVPVSPMLFQGLNWTFGSQLSGEVHAYVENATRYYDLIYDNNMTQMYMRP